MSSRLSKDLLWPVCLVVLATALSSCASSNRALTPAKTDESNSQPERAAVNSVPVIHVFVALADNVNQGIVPVSASLGNGDNASTNLYWGAAFGIRTFFSKNRDWQLTQSRPTQARRFWSDAFSNTGAVHFLSLRTLIEAKRYHRRLVGCN